MTYSVMDPNPWGTLNVRRQYYIDPDTNGNGICATYDDGDYKLLQIAPGFYVTSDYEIDRYLRECEIDRVHFLGELPL